MERMTCGNGGIGLGIALGLAEADSVQNLIERRLIYCKGETQKSPRVGPEQMRKLGFAEVSDFGPDEARAHYFAGRSDDLGRLPIVISCARGSSWTVRVRGRFRETFLQ
jgi:hypothetical protein